jgi:hypothetical protein
MNRLRAANTVPFANRDIAPVSGTPQYATNGIPGSVAPTIWPAYAYNQIQDELMAVITASGLTPDDTDWGQLLKALNRLFVPRIQVTSDMIIYVATSGNDLNNGLSPGPGGALLTIAAAINVIYTQYDWRGHNCTIQLADGTYNYNVAGGFLAVFPGMPFGMLPFGLTLQGNPTNPQNVIISATNANGIGVDRAFMYLNGFTIRATGGSWTITQIQGLGLNATRGGWAQCSNMRFDNTSGMFSVRSDWNGVVVLNGTNNAITGSGVYGICAGPFGTIYVTGSTLTVTGWAASTALWYADQGRIEAASVTFVGTATGTRYLAGYNSIINTSGGGANYFPGTVAGVTTTGGQYV